MKISVEELENIPDKQLTLRFNENIRELENSSPVEGVLTVASNGFSIKIEGNVKTKVNLECGKCLKNYIYQVDLDIDEEFVKDSIIMESHGEFELTGKDFVEELKGRKEIDLTDLIYQSITIDLTSQNVCGENCLGSDEYQKLRSEKFTDPRLEIFKQISDKINNE